jgi:hypothetical protein
MLMLLLYCLLLLFKVWQRSGSCCCYIDYHYCSMFNRGVVHVVVAILSSITVQGLTEEWFMFLLLLYWLPLLFKVWQRSDSFCCCYIVYNYCLRFDRGVVDVVVIILTTITVYGFTEEWFMLLLYCLPIPFKVWQRSVSCCCYIVYNYCLRFDRRGVHVVFVILCTTIV